MPTPEETLAAVSKLPDPTKLLQTGVDGAVTKVKNMWEMIHAGIAALFGGDDYEICFTAAVDSAPALEVIAAESEVVITCIGEVAAGTGVTVLDDGNIVSMEGNHGFDHFRGAEK